jgi:hypothetical protein
VVSSTTGSNYTSFVDNDGVNPIQFESSNVATGQYVRNVSTNTVGFTFTNDTSQAFQFTSEITPAGLGFYLADVNAACAYSGCAEVAGAGLSLTSLSKFSTIDPTKGYVSFTFSVTDTYTAAGTENQVDIPLFFATGSSTLIGANFSDDFDDASKVLNNFYGPGFPTNGFTYPASLTAHTFSWSATSIFGSMAPGVHQLSYFTQISSFANANSSGCASLVAFAGFGDPIGQAGAVESADFAFSSVDVAPCPHNDGGITGLNFTPETLKYSFTQPRDGSVPEPAAWAMMLLGFGGIGATLRRRRVLGATV